MDQRQEEPPKNQRKDTDSGAFLVGQLPYLQREHAARFRMARQIQRQGLRVVAVHMPRYPTERTLKQSVKRFRFNITETCAIDNEHKLRDAFQNDQGYVPAYYLFDSQGKLKSFAAGERGLICFTQR